jgi:exopolysaccharide biosynthesis polyprenyl glycosylphosphotransferase
VTAPHADLVSNWFLVFPKIWGTPPENPPLRLLVPRLHLRTTVVPVGTGVTASINGGDCVTILDFHFRQRVAAPPSRALRALPSTTFFLDLLVIIGVGTLAALGRSWLGLGDAAGLVDDVGVAAPLLLVSWVFAIFVAGGYRRNVFGAGTEELKRVVNASLATGGVVGVGCYVTQLPLDRGFFLLSFGIGIPALTLGRVVLRRALHSARRRGSLLQRVVIAGSRAHVDEIASVLSRERRLGYTVVGALTPAYDLSGETESGIPVLGDAGDATAVVQATGVDVILFAGGAFGSAAQMRKVVWELENQDVQLVVAPGVTDVSRDRIRVRPIGGLPLMHLEGPRALHASRWGKRIFDVIGSGLLILAFGPVLLAVAAVIKLHDGGPVLFRQTRVGRDAVEFGCFKFRTMVADAESLIAELQRQQGATALLFKMKDDPRITRPGKLLRRLSLDELPQLFNVFLGHMSLVGPRPQVPQEVALYDQDMSRRLRVRPGMTGLWQVSGRNNLSLADAIRLDLYYVDNWSMVQDLSILARTARAVLGSDGAY